LLERRDVPSALSVADVSVREGPTSVGVLDPSGATNLGINGMRDIAFNSNGDLFVGGFRSASVLRFDWASQTYQPFISSGEGGLGGYSGVAFDPTGNVYVASYEQNEIFCYDPTGAPLPAPGQTGALYAQGGGLNGLGNIEFGPDGNLYAVSWHTDQILRYQGPSGSSPGAFMDVFVNMGNTAPNRLEFGPDNDLYVAGFDNTTYLYTINRYDGRTGQPIGGGVFVSAASGGLHDSRQLLIDPSGTYLYVDEAGGEVLRFQGPNGTNPGAFVDTYITQGQAGLNQSMGVALDAAGNLYVSQRDLNEITRFAPSSQASFVVTLDSASTSPVSVNYATANGTAVAGTDFTQTSGTLVFPAGTTSETISVPITTIATGGPTKTFTMNLSSPMNATIAHSQATGSILSRMTKFYVTDTNSATTNIYEYGSGGTSEAITQTNNGTPSNSDRNPLGIAANSLGTKEWVVDGNKTVYVYNNGGGFIGSWSAGGLSSSATLTGIATNGTDIWLVDSYSDKVYKYAGAASLLSGGQSPASSFSLSNKHGNTNTNPQDLVTDGTSFWVVDGTALKVFKYTLSGTLLGSWAIDPANTHPTGITINPNNVSDIWIVDSGTLKVYEYAGAATRTSGSQSAAATFALNPSDTNPQGIADPPPADTLLPTAAAPLAVSEPATAAFSLVSEGGVAATPSLAVQEAAFALLASESLPGTPALGFQPCGGITPGPNSPTPAAPPVGQRPLDPVTLLSPWASAGSRLEDTDLLDSPLADGSSPSAVLATDGTAAWTAEDAATAP
jgi:WD40 repeat protein